MRFSCARCGQRYSSVDEPRAGLEYRIPCVACGAVVLLKGADFPVLPTAAPDPGAGASPGAVSDAAREEPLGLALGPMAVQQRATLPRGGVPRPAQRASAPSGRWIRIAIGIGVTLATAGAALLLVLGGPATDARARASSSGSTTTALPGGAAFPPPPGTTPTAAPSATRPVAPAAPTPGPGITEGASSQKTSPSPPGPSAVAASTAKRAPPPPAHRVASASSQPPTGAPPTPADAAPSPTPGGTVPAPPRAPAGAASAAAAARAAGPPPAPLASALAGQMMVEALAARRPALESCVRQWLLADPGAGLSGRRVTVSLVVNPSGTVTSSSIDDPSLETTALGACLRNVVSRPFRPFEGEPIQVVVPLRLGE